MERGGIVLETRDVHSLTDFLRNHKVHMARLNETRRAEVLTVHGRPGVVLLDPESYQHLLDRLEKLEGIASIRADFARTQRDAPPVESVLEEEMDRRRKVMRELMAETERLGLYQ